jgi:uncharacterized protein (TIGR03083 family)
VQANLYFASLRGAGTQLADAADGRLDEPIPSCPDWTMADLVGHLGQVVTFWGGVASGRIADPRQHERPAPPEADARIDWFRASIDSAADELASVDPTTERWNWSGSNQTAGWIARRMAHESAVHAWDGTAAVGAPVLPSTDLAIDGVDEFLEVFAPRCAERVEGPDATVHLHATDGDGEWLVRTSPGSIEFERGHAKGDAAVRGSAAELLLLCWRRVDPANLELFGDADAVARLLDAVRV